MKHDGSMLFSNDGIFAKRDLETGEMVWFFDSREGEIGPYSSEDLARKSILRHIECCKRSNLDGGRGFALARTIKLVNTYAEGGVLVLPPLHVSS